MQSLYLTVPYQRKSKIKEPVCVYIEYQERQTVVAFTATAKANVCKQTFALIFGGDGGNRTRVRKSIRPTFSGRIASF